jgi:hypothetical protein
LLNSTYVLLTAESYEGIPGAVAVEKGEQVEVRLKTLAREIFLNNDPVHAGAGFILGPVLIRGSQDHEQATIKFYDPQRRDMTLEIDSSAVTPDESPRLLNRIDQDIAASETPIHVLRRGKHDFAGMAGEEVLFTAEEKVDGGNSHVHRLIFTGESYRANPGLLRPAFALRLSAGGSVYWDSDEEHATRQAAPDYLMNDPSLPNFAAEDAAPSGELDPPPINASLTDHEATAVWDAILPTIRPRPGAVAPIQPKDNPFSQMPREDAERARQILDAFIASRPGDGSGF